MAADKEIKRKRKTSAEGSKTATERDEPTLRQRSDPRTERRYEPKPSTTGLITIIGAAAGALLAGMGTYAQWFRAESLGPHKFAPYLLAAGAALMIAVALFGNMGAKPIRVGDAGVAHEKDGGEIERIPWYEVTKIALTSSGLTFHSSGTFIAIPLRAHPQAAARALAEAKSRIPERAEDIRGDGLEKVSDAVGEVLKLEPPQAAGQHCKSSDKLIAFEKDARFCGRCGEIYHKESVPSRCMTCGATLRRGGAAA